MIDPHLFMWFVVAAVGVPSAWRNPTAAALVVSWLAGEAIWLITGDNLPVNFYLFPDVFVLAVIMAKKEYCNHQPYRNVWHQLACVLLERSPADRIVMLVFPVMWLLYAAPIDPYYVWWALYSLAIIQFLAASAESIASWRHERRRKSNPIIDLHLMVAVLFPHRAAERALLITANGGGGDG